MSDDTDTDEPDEEGESHEAAVDRLNAENADLRLALAHYLGDEDVDEHLDEHIVLSRTGEARYLGPQESDGVPRAPEPQTDGPPAEVSAVPTPAVRRSGRVGHDTPPANRPIEEMSDEEFDAAWGRINLMS